MLERMQLIRVFEEKVIELTHKKELEGLVHVGIRFTKFAADGYGDNFSFSTAYKPSFNCS